ncbi:flagellar biosynthesis protein FlgN [Ruegeria sp. 2012CJ41-6]|uniref:Flagellar biosynthesis protein FlgN n=1 Tax=Ruegeria spongiae TaxID=2942209 RepID=A0ABT0Q713_9RHOB|nr:flagellar biosynthesis protein FlgN [Ruegeria spongiae]MCL6284674.1 flagellar biosynthesis protein FlgN [Ruegeria spongiae]
MGKKNQTSAISKLNELLDQERQLLISGALDQVAALTPAKEFLLDGVAQDSATVGDLDAIRVKADQNRVLFDAALAGLRSVVERLSELKRLQSGFDTYDRSGQRQQHEPGGASKLEKRA